MKLKDFNLWFSFVILIMTVIKEAESLTPTEKNQITQGLQAGETIAAFISSKEFSGTMTKIASSASVYLGVLGPFMGAILSFIPSESAELTFMKQMMERIDNRFDQMDSRFNEVVRLIDWNVVRVNFGQIEQKILAMAEEYEYLYKVPANARENRKTIFLNNYNSDFQNSGLKLYQAITEPQGLFREKLGTSVMRYTKNDRKKTQEFLLGVLQLLLQAVKIELASYQVQSFNPNAMFMANEWKRRIQEVRREFENIDRAVTNKYHDQSEKDLEDYARDNSPRSLSNSDFSSGLFDLLSEKYYWRHWVVIVYNPIRGWERHTVSTCGGHIKFRENGRNIVVGSVDENDSTMNLGGARRQMENVAVTKSDFWRGTTIRRALDVYNSLNKDDACVTTVIQCYNDLYMSYNTRRFQYVNRCPYFNLIMWG